MSNARYYWVDSAKGIGVILVVLGHLLYDSSHDSLNRLIYSFHAPMFFFLSGFVYHFDRSFESKPKIVIKKAKRLLIPFILFTILGAYRIYEGIGKVDTVWLIRQTFYIDGKLYFNAPLWFLIVLFEIYIVEIITDCYNRGLFFKLLFVGILFIIGAFITSLGKNNVFNYFGLNRMLICLFFFEIGVLFRYFFERTGKKNYSRIEIVITVVCLLLWMWLLNKNETISIYGFIINNYYLFVINALLGTAVVIGICRVFLNKMNVLCKLSRYSILILGTQFFLIMPFLEKTQELGITRTFQYDLWGALILFTIIIIIPMVFTAIKRWIPIIRILNGEI